MILFCEDCGEKNDLNPSELSAGRAVFTCAVCGYGNAYPVDVPKTASSAMVSTLLGDIISFPEIIGGFYYDKSKGIIARRMPGILSRDDLCHLGRVLSDSFRSGMSSLQDIQDMTVLIADKYFFVHQINRDGFLVVAATSTPLPEPVPGQIRRLGKQAGGQYG